MIVLTNTTYNKTELSLFTSRRDFRRWPVASQLNLAIVKTNTHRTIVLTWHHYKHSQVQQHTGQLPNKKHTTGEGALRYVQCACQAGHICPVCCKQPPTFFFNGNVTAAGVQKHNACVQEVCGYAVGIIPPAPVGVMGSTPLAGCSTAHLGLSSQVPFRSCRRAGWYWCMSW